MKKDIHIQKLKIVISKIEAFIKATGVTQDQINRACSMTQEEL
jgi:hypothetical protein